jgi:hypothetical protein
MAKIFCDIFTFMTPSVEDKVLTCTIPCIDSSSSSSSSSSFSSSSSSSSSSDVSSSSSESSFSSDTSSESESSFSSWSSSSSSSSSSFSSDSSSSDSSGSSSSSYSSSSSSSYSSFSSSSSSSESSESSESSSSLSSESSSSESSESSSSSVFQCVDDFDCDECEECDEFNQCNPISTVDVLGNNCCHGYVILNNLECCEENRGIVVIDPLTHTCCEKDVCNDSNEVCCIDDNYVVTSCEITGNTCDFREVRDIELIDPLSLTISGGMDIDHSNVSETISNIYEPLEINISVDDSYIGFGWESSTPEIVNPLSISISGDSNTIESNPSSIYENKEALDINITSIDENFITYGYESNMTELIDPLSITISGGGESINKEETSSNIYLTEFYSLDVDLDTLSNDNICINGVFSACCNGGYGYDVGLAECCDDDSLATFSDNLQCCPENDGYIEAREFCSCETVGVSAFSTAYGAEENNIVRFEFGGDNLAEYFDWSYYDTLHAPSPWPKQGLVHFIDTSYINPNPYINYIPSDIYGPYFTTNYEYSTEINNNYNSEDSVVPGVLVSAIFKTWRVVISIFDEDLYQDGPVRVHTFTGPIHPITGDWLDFVNVNVPIYFYTDDYARIEYFVDC